MERSSWGERDVCAETAVPLCYYSSSALSALAELPAFYAIRIQVLMYLGTIKLHDEARLSMSDEPRSC